MLFCPGGQAEMVHAWKAFLPGEKRELVLHTRHKGFCRWVLSLHDAAPVVVSAGVCQQCVLLWFLAGNSMQKHIAA